MKDLVLLGAGASVDAGLPTSFGLTSEVSKASALPEPGKPYGAPDLAAALAFAIGTLYQQRGAAGINPIKTPGIDIEELIDAIDSLAHPDASGLTPFVSGWHPFLRDVDATLEDRHRMTDAFVDDLERIRLASSLREAAAAKDHATAALRLALMLSQPKFAFALFRRLKTALVHRTGQILWLPPDGAANKVKYLAPLLAAQDTECIATLNYDNAIETCAADLGISLGLGFDEYASSGHLSFNNPGKRFLKLHGSLDWMMPEDVEDQRDYPGRRALRFGWRRVQPSSSDWSSDSLGIVLGRHKMQAPGPFLDLLQRFVSELSSAARLVIVGYSFRDDHINRAIVQFMMGRPQTQLVLVDPALADHHAVIVDVIRRFPGRVRIWNVTAAHALSTYAASPEWPPLVGNRT